MVRTYPVDQMVEGSFSAIKGVAQGRSILIFKNIFSDYAFADIKEEEVNEEDSKVEEKDNVSVEKETTSHKSLKEDKEKQKGKG